MISPPSVLSNLSVAFVADGEVNDGLLSTFCVWSAVHSSPDTLWPITNIESGNFHSSFALLPTMLSSACGPAIRLNDSLVDEGGNKIVPGEVPIVGIGVKVNRSVGGTGAVKSVCRP